MIPTMYHISLLHVISTSSSFFFRVHAFLLHSNSNPIQVSYCVFHWKSEIVLFIAVEIFLATLQASAIFLLRLHFSFHPHCFSNDKTVTFLIPLMTLDASYDFTSPLLLLTHARQWVKLYWGTSTQNTSCSTICHTYCAIIYITGVLSHSNIIFCDHASNHYDIQATPA